jgi:class 3 adenylate cyclase
LTARGPTSSGSVTRSSATSSTGSAGREIDNAGDGFLAAFDGPARAIACASAIVDVRSLGLSIRAGVHTGECELVADKLSGLVVHVGVRITATARGDEILVSSTVRDLFAGSEIEFDERGTHTLEGVPGEWALFAVREGRPAAAGLPARAV